MIEQRRTRSGRARIIRGRRGRRRACSHPQPAVHRLPPSWAGPESGAAAGRSLPAASVQWLRLAPTALAVPLRRSRCPLARQAAGAGSGAPRSGRSSGHPVRGACWLERSQAKGPRRRGNIQGDVPQVLARVHRVYPKAACHRRVLRRGRCAKRRHRNGGDEASQHPGPSRSGQSLSLVGPPRGAAAIPSGGWDRRQQL